MPRGARRLPRRSLNGDESAGTTGNLDRLGTRPDPRQHVAPPISFDERDGVRKKAGSIPRIAVGSGRSSGSRCAYVASVNAGE
jgi:hypothetical protein